MEKKKTVTRQTSKFLRHDFTDEEKRELAEEMARKVTEANELVKQQSDSRKEYQAKIDVAETKASSNATKITSGYEFRDIDCEEILDYEEREVRVIRLDTGEQVERRAMSNYELQQDLDLRAA